MGNLLLMGVVTATVADWEPASVLLEQPLFAAYSGASFAARNSHCSAFSAYPLSGSASFHAA